MFVYLACCAPAALKRSEERAYFISHYFGERTLDPLEGIWTEPEQTFEIIIAKDTENRIPDAEYLGFIGSTIDPDFKSGDLHFVMRGSNREGLYNIEYFYRRDSSIAAQFNYAGGEAALLWLPEYNNNEQSEKFLFKLYPEKAETARRITSGNTTAGTGFFVTRNMVATNYHIVDGTSSINVLWKDYSFPARLVGRDEINDIALLELQFENSSTEALIAIRDIAPVSSTRDYQVEKDDRIFMFDIPLSADYYMKAKVGRGSVVNTFAINNDYRMLDIDLIVRPGNSGSPVFDRFGNVVGIITSLVKNNSITLVERPVSGERGEVSRQSYYASVAVKVKYLESLMRRLPSPAKLYNGQEEEIFTLYDLKRRNTDSIVLVQGIIDK